MSGNVQITPSAEYRGSGVTIRAQGPATFSRVFVSSTRRDLDDYRQQVEQTLGDFLQMSCFLGERMATGYVSTVRACLDEVDAAGGFIGIFAYWYGSIPPPEPGVVGPGEPCSITHMEFNRARERQKAQPDFPIAVFMPQDPSAAKAELEARALALLGADADERRLHEERLRKFHEDVRGGWRVVRDFKDCGELCMWVIAICSQWRGLTPMAAAHGRVEVVESTPGRRLPTEEELGLLGRAAHFKAVEDALALAPAFPDEPALAFLLSGDEDAGQRAFLQRLLTTAGVRAGRPPRIVRPPYGQCDPASLVQLVGDGLGLAGGAGEPASPRELAEAVHAGLQSQQLCFVLDQAHRVAGGVAAFREQFWLPLYTRLKELRAERPTEHRLLGFVADYAGRGTDAWGETARPHDDPAGPDYSRLLLLPALAQFTRLDVLRWMNDLKVPDKPPGRRAALADAVLKDPMNQPDATPRRVFDRLEAEDLWPEGDD